jgi:lysophospholipase L1-like esterase
LKNQVNKDTLQVAMRIVRPIVQAISKLALATLVFFVVLESLIRVTYFIRNSMADSMPLPFIGLRNYGPVPPWIEGLKMIEGVSPVSWRGRPNFHQKYVYIFTPLPSEDDVTNLIKSFLPTFPKSLKNNPIWNVSLNDEGFRDDNFPNKKDPNIFRIICLGDSWTFGYNLDRNESYPRLLQVLLEQAFSNAHFEVINLGVIGYTSYQGANLIRRALELEPDLMIIGFAMNDPGMLQYVEYVEATKNNHNPLAKTIQRVFYKVEGYLSKKIEFYKLLKYWARALTSNTKTTAEHLREVANKKEYYEDIKDTGNHRAWEKRTLRLYEQNFLNMIASARKNGTDIVLLYPQYSTDGPFLKALEKISRVKGVPLVDSSRLIADARREIEDEIEERLGLEHSNVQKTNDNDKVEVVFRVFAGKYAVTKAIYITGTNDKLGNLVPNKIAMYDDGTHGDQRAGDRVWSYSTTFPIGMRVFYLYTRDGAEGRWVGLDVPDVRYLKVEDADAANVVYGPVDSFGKMYMQADAWHTDAAGNELIAKAVFEKIKQSQNLKRYLSHRPADKMKYPPH